MIEQEYELMKRLFLKFVETTPGPWRIDLLHLARLYVAERINTPSIINISLVRDTMGPIWKRMVFELCPLQMVIANVEIPALIKEIDDNVDYIYACAKLATDNKVHVLHISNPVIAAMLRIKNGS